MRIGQLLVDVATSDGVQAALDLAEGKKLPVGARRKWQRGLMVKTAHGWEDVPDPSKKARGEVAMSKADQRHGPLVPTKKVGRRWVLMNGQELPEHVRKYPIPPTYTDVRVCLDPKSGRVWSAKSGPTKRHPEGKVQTCYTKEFKDQSSAKKFDRVKEFASKVRRVQSQVEKDMKSPNYRLRETACCAYLILHTALRPGSQKNLAARGATTLGEEHIIIEKGGKVRMKFPAKSHTNPDLEVADAHIADMLEERKLTAKNRGGRIFDTDARRLNRYIHTLDGGAFTTKDLRTHLGTKWAAEAMLGRKPPKDKKEYVAATKHIAEMVSSRLGNTPAVAIKSYINASVFAPWRHHAKV